MTPIIWIVTCSVVLVLVFFVWVVASNWQDKEKAKLRANEENESTLTLEQLMDIERSFN